MNHHVKHYVIYARVSTASQNEGTSIASQIQQCRDLAASIGGRVTNVYSESISGGLYLSRMQLQAAISDIEEGKANGVIMFDLERFARHAAYQEIAVERIQRAGGEIHFCRDEFSNTPEGKMLRGIRGHVAQYYREKQRVLSRMGHYARAQAGIMPNRSVFPYGYRITQNRDVKTGTATVAGVYQIVESQAQWVRFMYEKIVSGWILQNVADELNSRKVPTPRGGRQWLTGTIYTIVKNPVHKGEALFGEYHSEVDDERAKAGLQPYYRVKSSDDYTIIIPAPPIVSAEIWQQCQHIMSQRGRFKSRKLSSEIGELNKK